MVAKASSSISKVPSVASGGSLNSETVILIVAILLVEGSSSSAVKVKESAPLKPALGS